MTNKPPAMTLKVFGTVSNGIKQPIRHGWSQVVSEIVVDSALTEALEGLEEFSHLIVLYWMHRLPPRSFRSKSTPWARRSCRWWDVLPAAPRAAPIRWGSLRSGCWSGGVTY